MNNRSRTDFTSVERDQEKALELAQRAGDIEMANFHMRLLMEAGIDPATLVEKDRKFKIGQFEEPSTMNQHPENALSGYSEFTGPGVEI
jgi:hypothetical protein